MSGILLPMVHTANTIDGVVTPVGIDHVVSASKVDAVAVGAGGSDEHKIVLSVVGEGSHTPREVEWRYVDAATRDTDFDALVALVSAAL